MAYDEQLAERVRSLLADRADLSERRMFGGIGFMLGGNMCCGVHGDELILRLGEDGADEALEDPHARPFDMTGRPMKGWLLVAPAALETDEGLRRWVDPAIEFASSLPPK